MSTPSVTSPILPTLMNHDHSASASQPYRTQWHINANGAGTAGPTPPSAMYMSRAASTMSSYSPVSMQSQSVPSTPDGPVAASPSETVCYTPLLLPRTPSIGPAYTTSPATPLADAGNVGRQKGLMRRLSRSTGNRLRRGTSSNNMREQASGSVVVRSGPQSTTESSFEISDYELDESDGGESFPGQPRQRKPSTSRSSTSSAWPVPRQLGTSKYPKTATAPTTRLESLQGTAFVKYTSHKRKNMHFFLHQKGARLSWSTSNDKSKGKSLYLDHIRELRFGPNAFTHLREFGLPEEALDRWLTVTYIDSEGSKGRASKSLHLLAPDRRTRDAWIEWLNHVMYIRGDMMAKIAGISDEHREKVWINFVNEKPPTTLKEERECMSFAELKSVCRKWAINKSESDLKQRFDDVDPLKYGYLNKLQFLELFRNLAERRELKGLFASIKKSDQSQLLQLQDFMAFLHEIQGVDVDADLDYWTDVFRLYQVTIYLDGKAQQGMSWQTFQDFMVSDHLAWDASQRKEGTLDRPFNEYWISSSHNTYLKGRQVYGTSDAEEYVVALKKGCRCVEIDVWDGADGQPTVTHGRTLTSKRPFEECIDRVNKFAFCSSEYPLSISLEVHCNAVQQVRMAEIMTRHFGSKMLVVPLHEGELRLPSPEQLKGKILIKVKKPAVSITTGTGNGAALAVPNPSVHRRQRSQSEPNPRLRRGQVRKMSSPQWDAEESFGAVPPLPSVTFPIAEKPDARTPATPTTLTSGASSISGSTSDDSDVDPLESTAPKKRKKIQSKIVPALGNLGVYLRGVKISSFHAPEAKEYNHIFSFNENTFEEHCKTQDSTRLLEEHNMRYLMRVYPRGSRIESSNFNPIQFWRRGVQMVATNWQTHDLGTQINDAMFAVGSDRSGYVLKPEALRPAPLGTASKALTKKLVRFSVEIISARRLARTADMSEKTEMNPYVEVEVLMADDPEEGQAVGEGGSSASARDGKLGMGAPPKQRTIIIAGNGFDPMWHQSMHFTLETRLPELVFVRFSVFNSADPKHLSTSKEPLASFTAKLCTLPQGYRHFSLRRGNNDKLLSQLFCKIHKEEVRELGSTESIASYVPRSSEESTRSSATKDKFRNLFQRTPSQSRKGRREYPGGGLISRTTSTER